MLYDSIYIGKVVCLKCGAKTDVDKLAVLDVGAMDDLPEDVKARGSFFQTLACPKCKKSAFLGFVAEEDEEEKETKVEAPEKKARKRRKRKSKKKKAAESDIIDTNGEEPEMPEQKQSSSGIVRSEDGTINLEAAPNKVNRLPRQKAVCSRCSKQYDVGTQGLGGFGSKCPDCMKILVGGANK